MSQESDGQREMRSEYDIRGGVRGKYLERYRETISISVTLEDSPLISKDPPTAPPLGQPVWSVSYLSPSPSPTVQVGRLEPADSSR